MFLLSETLQTPGYHPQRLYLHRKSPAEHSYNSILELVQNAQDSIGRYKKHDTRRTMNTVYYAGGKDKPFNTPTNQIINENGRTLPLTVFPIHDMQLPIVNNPLLIAGGGTAGIAAALSAAEKGQNLLSSNISMT